MVKIRDEGCKNPPEFLTTNWPMPSQFLSNGTLANLPRKEVEYAGPIFNTKGSYKRRDSPHLCFKPRRGQDALDHSMIELLHFIRKEGRKVRWASRKKMLIYSSNWWVRSPGRQSNWKWSRWLFLQRNAIKIVTATCPGDEDKFSKRLVWLITELFIDPTSRGHTKRNQKRLVSTTPKHKHEGIRKSGKERHRVR